MVGVDLEVIYQNATLYKKIQYNGGSRIDVNLATGSFRAYRSLASSQLLGVDVPNLVYTGVELNRLEPDGETVILNVAGLGIRSATSLMQLRANIIGRATSYLVQ